MSPVRCAGFRDPDWMVVIPVKHTALGKSRLGDPGPWRTALARAIALDTISAAVQAARVVVVTADEWVTDAARGRGAVVVPDPGRGLDAAVASVMPATGLRAALLGDLPALHPGDLVDALRRAAAVPRGVVADADGTGSTLLTAGPGADWASAFGEGSFDRHVALGCVPLRIPDESSLRRDVDTREHLRAAADLGVGSATAAVLEATRLQA